LDLTRQTVKEDWKATARNIEKLFTRLADEG